MEMNMKHLILGALLLVTISIGCTGGEVPEETAAPTTPQAPTTTPPPVVQINEEGKALFEDRCSVCHSLSYPATRGARSLMAWRGTVKEMIANGADVTDEEIEPIAEYLFQMYGT